MRDNIRLCSGGPNPGPRDKCTSVLHDWPLPAGYNAASDIASSRLSHGWKNVKCRKCGLYGWLKGDPTPYNDTRVRATK